MFIRRLLSSISKTPKIITTPIFEPFCEIEFNKILSDLNIRMITLTMKQKHEEEKEKQDEKEKNERYD